MFTTYTSKIKVISDFSNLLKERIDKANPRRKLTAEESKRLNYSKKQRKMVERVNYESTALTN
jgi:hypothetical protein